MEFVDLKAQYQALKPEIDEAVERVMTEAAFIMGDEVRTFEEELAADIGVRHVISCGNGTDALVMALMARDIGPGDAVFVPSFTFMSTAEAASNVGATPVMCDILPDSYNLDPASLTERIEAIKRDGRLRPAAIISVDLFGRCADYAAIEAIAEAHHLYLVEDGAQGYGAVRDGRPALSFGDLAITSFFPAKPLGGYGDGGAIFTDDDELAERCRSLRVHGRGRHKYDNVRVGMNSRLDTIQAAVLRVKLRAFRQGELDARQALADYYEAELASLYRTPAVPAGEQSAWAQFTLMTDGPEDRDRIRKVLDEAGVPSAVYYVKPLHKQRVYQGQYGADVSLPVSERAADAVLQIPMHPYMSESDAAKVTDALRRAADAKPAGVR